MGEEMSKADMVRSASAKALMSIDELKRRATAMHVAATISPGSVRDEHVASAEALRLVLREAAVIASKGA